MERDEIRLVKPGICRFCGDKMETRRVTGECLEYGCINRDCSNYNRHVTLNKTVAQTIKNISVPDEKYNKAIPEKVENKEDEDSDLLEKRIEIIVSGYKSEIDSEIKKAKIIGYLSVSFMILFFIIQAVVNVMG